MGNLNLFTVLFCYGLAVTCLMLVLHLFCRVLVPSLNRVHFQTLELLYLKFLIA